MGDFKKIYAILPPQNQQMALRDRKNFLQQWAFMRRLSKMAEDQKLDEQSPTKEALAYYRMMILSQAKVNDEVAATTVEPGEIVKYYDVNKDKYKQVKVKAIYIGFGSEGGRKILEASEVGELQVTWRRERRSAPPDALLLPTDQPLGAVGVYLCEPESDDGAVENGWLPAPKLGEDFPIWRVR